MIFFLSRTRIIIGFYVKVNELRLICCTVRNSELLQVSVKLLYERMTKSAEKRNAGESKRSDYESSEKAKTSTGGNEGSVFKSGKAVIIYAIIGLLFIAAVSFISASVIQKDQNHDTLKEVNNTKILVSESGKNRKSNKKTIIKNGKQFVVLSKKEVSRSLSLLKVMFLGPRTAKEKKFVGQEKENFDHTIRKLNFNDYRIDGIKFDKIEFEKTHLNNIDYKNIGFKD